MTLTYAKRVIGTSPGSTVSYNGFTFPPALNASIQIKPVLDSAKRVTKYIECVIRIEGILNDADSNGTFGIDVETALFSTLVQSGRQLLFFGVGLDNFLTDSAIDITFGPHPKMVSWRPLADKTCYFVWECEFTGLACESTSSYGVEEYVWSASFSIAQDGTTIRVIKGHVTSLGRRTSVGSTTVQQCADDLRPLLQFPVLPNFERNSTWELSEDRRTLMFQVTDTEIKSDNPYFPYMVKMNVQESLTGGQAVGGFEQWNFSLSGTIEVAPGVPRLQAWLAFLTIIQDRIAAGPEGSTYTRADGTTEKIERWNESFGFSNDIYGRTVGFNYGHTMTCSLQDILSKSGIWRPVPASGWQAWSTSLSELRGVRGIAGLSVTAADDVIVDYCHPFNPQKSVDNPTEKAQQYTIENILKPACKDVWIRYENVITIGRESSTTEVIKYNVEGGDSEAPLDTKALSSNKGGAATTAGSSGFTNHVQERGPSSTVIQIKGHAVRQQELIEAPKIVSIGGKPAVLQRENISANVLLGRTQAGCPVYGLRWTRIYFMPEGSNQKDVVVEGTPNGWKS